MLNALVNRFGQKLQLNKCVLMSIWLPVCMSTCLSLSPPLARPVCVTQAGLHAAVKSSGIRAAHHTSLCAFAFQQTAWIPLSTHFFTSVLKVHEERLNGSLENKKESLQSLNVKSDQILQNGELRTNKFDSQIIGCIFNKWCDKATPDSKC